MRNSSLGESEVPVASERPGAGWSLAALGMLVGTLAVAAVATRDAFVAIYRINRPEWALAARSWDPVAVAVATDRRLAESGAAGFPPDDRVRGALARDPLNAALLRIAGMAAQARGDQAQARKLVGLAERLSRRDLATQVWLVEDAIGRSDVAGAIAHYDRALSVQPAVWEQFFPVIAAGLEYPEVRDALIPYVRRERAWAMPFLSYAATQGEAATRRHLMALLDRAGILGMDASSEVDALTSLLLRRLIAEEDYRGAFALAARMAGPDAAGLGDIAVTPRSSLPSLQPLTWQLGNGEGVLARLGEQNRVRIRASRGRRAMALSRVLALPPGRYELGMLARYPGSAPIAAADWNWVCLGGARDRQIGRADVQADRGARSQVFHFEVAATCPAVRLELMVTGADDLTAGEMVIDELALRRTSAPSDTAAAR